MRARVNQTAHSVTPTVQHAVNNLAHEVMAMIWMLGCYWHLLVVVIEQGEGEGWLIKVGKGWLCC